MTAQAPTPALLGDDGNRTDHWIPECSRAQVGLPREETRQGVDMNILIPSAGPESWQDLLPDPEKRWRDGHSAKMLAESWDRAQGFPSEVRDLLASSPEPALAEATPLIGIPEYQVPLPGGSRPSQNDLFVLAAAGSSLATIMIEGKVEEPFGPTVAEWLTDASPGKHERLKFLQEKLGLREPPCGNIRYQLLHRTASAVIEAQRFRARFAVMIVHSFSSHHTWLDDYQAFLALFAKERNIGDFVLLSHHDGIELYCGWAAGRANV